MNTKCEQLWGTSTGFVPFPPVAMKILRSKGLSYGHVCLAILLMHHVRLPGFSVWPSYATLAKCMVTDPANIGKLIRTLEQKGLVIVERGKRRVGNKYDMKPIHDLIASAKEGELELAIPGGVISLIRSSDITMEEAFSKAKYKLARQIPDSEVLTKLTETRECYGTVMGITNEAILDEVVEFFEKQLMERSKLEMAQWDLEDSL